MFVDRPISLHGASHSAGDWFCVVFRCVCSYPLQSAWDATGSRCVQRGKCPCKLKDPGQQGTEKTTEKREREVEKQQLHKQGWSCCLFQREGAEKGDCLSQPSSLFPSLSLKVQSIEIQTSALLLFFPLLCGYTHTLSHTLRNSSGGGKKP